MSDGKTKHVKKFTDGEFRELKEGKDDVLCFLCDKSIWEVDMVLGVEERTLCEECFTQCLILYFSGIKNDIKANRLDERKFHNLMAIGAELNDITTMLKAAADADKKKKK